MFIVPAEVLWIGACHGGGRPYIYIYIHTHSYIYIYTYIYMAFLTRIFAFSAKSTPKI